MGGLHVPFMLKASSANFGGSLWLASASTSCSNSLSSAFFGSLASDWANALEAKQNTTTAIVIGIVRKTIVATFDDVEPYTLAHGKSIAKPRQWDGVAVDTAMPELCLRPRRKGRTNRNVSFICRSSRILVGLVTSLIVLTKKLSMASLRRQTGARAFVGS